MHVITDVVVNCQCFGCLCLCQKCICTVCMRHNAEPQGDGQAELA